jgi:hypothetical protein
VEGVVLDHGLRMSIQRCGALLAFLLISFLFCRVVRWIPYQAHCTFFFPVISFFSEVDSSFSIAHAEVIIALGGV